MATSVGCRREPALADAAFKKALVLLPAMRHDLGNRATAVSDDDRLAGRSQPNVLAQLVLQNFQTDGAHLG